VFSSEIPAGLPPIRGIEHQIDLILDAFLSNRAPYRTNRCPTVHHCPNERDSAISARTTPQRLCT
jgi:hypothetical protein